MPTNETYREKIEGKLVEARAMIEKLKTDFNEEDEQKKIKYLSHLDDLETKASFLEMRLKELREMDGVRDEEWEDYKMRMHSAISDVSVSIQQTADMMT